MNFEDTYEKKDPISSIPNKVIIREKMYAK